VLGLALAVWPLVAHRIGERVKASMVDVDEQWLKSRGRWPYGFVVLEVDTALPVLAALLPSRSPWACRWLGRPRHQLTHVPRVLITDGLPASTSLVPAATHVWCRVHHQPGVTHGLPQHFTTDEELNARQPVMKRLFHTPDQRTVRRRLARLKARAAALGMTPWVTGVEAKSPQLMGRVGSTRVPSTTNAIARFFRAFERFDNTRKGCHSAHSAKRELRLLLVV
jgi:transposase-like protein